MLWPSPAVWPRKEISGAPIYLCPALVLSIADINVDEPGDHTIVYGPCEGCLGKIARNVDHCGDDVTK